MFTSALIILSFAGIVTCAKQPNILLVVADDYGWNDIGYHGSEIKTPTLDSLANDGVKLENYYIQPICTPSRSQLLSGRYQIHTGLQHGVLHPLQPNSLPLDDVTMADKLRQVGYSTHIVGKWHLGMYKKECTPTMRGFDTFFGYYNGMEDYYQHNQCEGISGYDLHDNFGDNFRNADEFKGQYSTHIFTKRVEEIVANHEHEHEDKPLFMYVPFQAVHAPLEVPAHYEEPYAFINNKARRTYAGMVSALDEAIKNITEAYKSSGLWDNTIMIFSTDNGGEVHAGGNNWPLRGWKDSLWEGGMHGVGFVSGGKVLEQKGMTNNGLIHISDWFPTLVNLAGGSTDGLKLDGHDVWASITKGVNSPRKELLHNIDPLEPLSGSSYPHSGFDTRVRAAIRVGDYKLITGNPGNDTWVPPANLTHSEDGPVFLSLESEKPHEEGNLHFTAETDTVLRFSPKVEKPKVQNVWLFNIKEDPNEYKDLSEKMPEKVTELLDRMAAYNATAVPCRYPKNDPRANPKLHGGYWEPWE